MERLCADALHNYQRLLLNIDQLRSSHNAAGSLEGTSYQHSSIDQPKPQHSYIGLIGMAILSSPERKMVLSEVYDWIMSHYPYFRSRGSGWRNSIRHNLSLNDCFVKAGRAANGKGHYWAVHPANIRDFERGDFRRRRAQRKVRRHMGLAVPEGESSDESPSPPPLGLTPVPLPVRLPGIFGLPLSFLPPAPSMFPNHFPQRELDDLSPSDTSSPPVTPVAVHVHNEVPEETKPKPFSIDFLLRNVVA